jgi:error-prone DNA polymerase
LKRFYARIGRRFLGAENRKRARALAKPRNGRMSKDVVPAEVRELIRRERDASGATWVEIGRATGLGMREIQGSTETKRGFRRSVIERLAHYFDSDDLTRLATSDLYWDRIMSIEPVGRRMTYDLEIEGNHNFLANDFVVHNSHAASFALIAYATAYLKCHYLPEFTCALLNSWPMGFYTPATVVQDGKRHGLVVRPVDVLHSVWSCTMETCGHSTGGFAVRMGLRYVKGLREDEGEKIEAAVRAVTRSHRSTPFRSIEDFASRTGASGRAMRLLAEAGAFDSLKSNRRAALWHVQGMKKETMRSYQSTAGGERATGAHVAESDLPLGEPVPTFASLSEIDTVAWDFRTMNHSARSHLLEPFREELTAKGLPDARTVSRMRDGRRVDYAGIVICRQRPGTASGVVFMTMEDETGFVNTILWPSVYEKFTVQARTLSFLGVSGKVQAADGVVHVVVDKLWDPREHAKPVSMQSRDFH